MKVLVTGSNGMLGQDLCPIFEDNGVDVIETDVDTLDITNPDMVEQVLKEHKPDVVIHCAAYTSVDKAEEEKEIAERINVIGTKNVALASNAIGATLVYISTDYVFDGTKSEPYIPEDQPNPINNYGWTKLAGEKLIEECCEKYYIVRTSWLYGHHGNNFVETMVSLSSKDEISVVDDQIGCPTWTVELANAILEIIEEELEFGIYHVCGSGQTSWFGFAKEIFEQLNLKVKLKPCTTEEFPRPAKRPKYSVMDNEGFCRDWKIALKEYLELRIV